MSSNLNVAAAMAAALKRHGVMGVFGQSIPSLFHLSAPDFGIRQIGYRTENAGGAMADGYARISRKIGVVTAQNGPAATLLVPPMAEAMVVGVPMLAIVEEVPASDAGRNAFQEFDHVALFQSCAKWIGKVECASRVDDYVDMAMVQALSGRPGPVVLLTPRDVLAQPFEAVRRRISTDGEFPLDRLVPDRNRLGQAAELIAKARRPVLVAGGGVLLSGAQQAVGQLSELAGIPVATTNMGKGSIDERAPLSLGMFGNCMGAGTSASHLKSYVSEADLVILVGTRTNQNGTDTWTLYPEGATYIHIDIDAVEIGRNYESVRLVGDALETLEALCALLQGTDFSQRAAFRAEVAEATASARVKGAARLSEIGKGAHGAIRPEYLMQVLDTMLRPDDIVVADASYSTNWVANYLTCREAGSRFLLPRGLAGLGWGYPMALGAQYARPGSRVFAVVGDGGFGHCWSELETARRMGLNVVALVLNNQILGYQTHGENAFFGAHSDACEFRPVDHTLVAQACDCFAERVSDPDQIAAALERALASGKPALLDVMTDPLAHPPLNAFEGRNTVAPMRGLGALA